MDITHLYSNDVTVDLKFLRGISSVSMTRIITLLTSAGATGFRGWALPLLDHLAMALTQTMLKLACWAAAIEYFFIRVHRVTYRLLLAAAGSGPVVVAARESASCQVKTTINLSIITLQELKMTGSGHSNRE